MFLGTGTLKNFVHSTVPVLEFLFNKVAGLQVCNFIEKRLQHRCFHVKFTKSLIASFLQNPSGGCFWKYLMNSLFIAYENVEWHHCVVHVGSPALISFYCACFVFFYFFLLFCFIIFFFFCGFCYLLRYWVKFFNT